MTTILTVEQYLATSHGAGLSEDDAQIYVDIANSILNTCVDPVVFDPSFPDLFPDTERRLRSAAILITNAIKSNPTLLQSLSAGGVVSLNFRGLKQISEEASVLIGELAVTTGDEPAGVSQGLMERDEC